MKRILILTSIFFNNLCFAGQSFYIVNLSNSEIVVQYYSLECSFGAFPCDIVAIPPGADDTMTDNEFFIDPTRRIIVNRAGAFPLGPDIKVPAWKHSICQVIDIDGGKRLEVKCRK